MWTIDSETCGLHGPIILFQYAIDDGQINLYLPWENSINRSIELFEDYSRQEIIGFNLVFDHFKVCQMYTTLILLKDKVGGEKILANHLEDYAHLEESARNLDLCIKPLAACDIMLVARKTKYQSLMDRKDIRIKKIPREIISQVKEELEKRISLPEIYFAKRKIKKDGNWDIDYSKSSSFPDLVLKFKPSSGLKALAADALKVKMTSYSSIEIDKKFYPVEYGWAPFATAHLNKKGWNGAWPEVIRHHISHWTYNQRAREYASDDVKYTRQLYEFFGSPAPGDTESELAIMVASIRWRGFELNLPEIKELREKIREKLYFKDRKTSFGDRLKIPVDPRKSWIYLSEVMNEFEKGILKGSTKKVLLKEEIAKWDHNPKAMERAKEILTARQAQHLDNLLSKLYHSGRFHASFEIIGALSDRMSGRDGLNSQGITSTKEVREKFTLAPEKMVLSGGDFSGFEVTLADAVYNDPFLRQDLLSGKKIHALFGQEVYPNLTYQEILDSEGTENDIYSQCKRAVFGLFYGGNAFTLKTKLGVEIEIAEKAYLGFINRFKKVGEARKKIFDLFCSMKQEGGIGSKIVWREPAEYIESLFGFRRYFTLENSICKVLFNLANKPPKEWKELTIKVMRRDREQLAGNAAQSAIFAAAFAIQAANMRAAANHVIQSSGANITKAVQKAIWDLQPTGIFPFQVMPMNIHDEIMCPMKPEMVDRVEETVYSKVESFKDKVPLLKIVWKKGLKNWGQKK